MVHPVELVVTQLVATHCGVSVAACRRRVVQLSCKGVMVLERLALVLL